ncbi:phage protease [Cognaticolwellia mytili]|uniref:phage protease n=1 Tax=Cognaticolwellia mytili TaxID=1888913 RepID=UPI000A1705D7|nr:phage protease [Cognaticolwellia mytili]
MKTFQKNKVAIAALTKKVDTATAVLTFSVGSLSVDNSQRVQLLPDGEFSAQDGRPFDVEGGKWLMDAQAFASLKAAATQRTNDYLFDYEHQTLNSEENGEPAPAAGWFRDLEYIPGEGLFTNNVKWTGKAQGHIDDDEYRFTSSVFSYDTKTGRPIALMHAALTNDPALDGMKAIAALKAQSNTNPKTTPTGENPMNEAMKLLLGLLGVPTEGVDFTNEAALKAVQDKADVAIAALKTKADKAGLLQTELDTERNNVVALKASGGTVDPAKFVPITAYNEMAAQVVALKNGSDETSIEQLLNDNAAKVFGVADRAYLESLGKTSGVAALKAALEPRVAIAALTNQQTKDKATPTNPNADELSTEQIAICKNMGITTAAFKEQLAKQGEQ